MYARYVWNVQDCELSFPSQSPFDFRPPISISNRLLEMGYGPELSFLDNLRHVYPPDARIVLFHEHRLVRYPRVLTDKGESRFTSHDDGKALTMS